MGLLSIIRKIKRKEKEMRILMVGLDNSGKTTIVLKINGEDTSVISPTLGFNIKTIAYNKSLLLLPSFLLSVTLTFPYFTYSF
ncbi:ADP-ribosylation factor-like protein 2 [Camellia sinensis]|uniref:ADP-ribosylation factor-like protein 2 n=1 Tax=Camellia sinensis TaxID=4442 RepID=UPI001035CCB0|nr:ADP-ribosylation factor-like protein 2 [Camellia sinensis]XP_028053181.1 ADP-ribosylation factor-like protein 2 [Camellia sinensis]